MSRNLHIVPGTDDVANGMVVVARLLAKEQGDAEVVDLNHGMHRIHEKDVEEVWVHGMWLSKEWTACRTALRAGKRLVRMTHGSLSPIYLTRQSPLKKKLVSPVERYFLRRANLIVATCEAEAEWIRSYLGRRCPPIEVTDIKRFFKLNGNALTQSRRVAEYAESDIGLPSADGGLVQCPRDNSASSRLGVNSKNNDEPLHLLYLGRRHPLKGVEYLETAVRQIQDSSAHSAPLRLCVKNNEQAEPLHLLYLGRRHPLKGVEYLESAVNVLCNSPTHPLTTPPLLKIVSNAFGDELEKVWDWCDILVLPTLSDNFGLVIAEALEHGKRVITTDGAPAWGDGNTYGGRLVYLKGYRDGTSVDRCRLLANAIASVCY